MQRPISQWRPPQAAARLGLPSLVPRSGHGRGRRQGSRHIRPRPGRDEPWARTAGPSYVQASARSGTWGGLFSVAMPSQLPLRSTPAGEPPCSRVAPTSARERAMASRPPEGLPDGRLRHQWKRPQAAIGPLRLSTRLRSGRRASRARPAEPLRSTEVPLVRHARSSNRTLLHTTRMLYADGVKVKELVRS